MASHAHEPGDSVSAARITAYGVIGAALIGAIAATLNLLVGHDKGPDVATGPTPTTISHPPMTQASDQGSVDKVAIHGSVDEVEINGARTEVTVTGSAEKDVDSVAVLIGPRHSAGQQFWATVGNVFNQQWKLSIATEPHLLEPYTIKAVYHSVSAAVPKARVLSKLPFQGIQPTPPPSPSPTNEIVNCAEQFGPGCFTGPGWGPPSSYQSK
jgi:hypothetical protein